MSRFGPSARKASEAPLLIVGLGNPEPPYETTRHNVGFLLLDEIGSRHQISVRQKGRGALKGNGSLCGRKVILAKPQTFMNRSGPVVGTLMKALGLSPAELLLIHDDFDIAWGRLRVKRSGGDAGHLGVRSVIESLGTRQFTRLRIGLGRPLEAQQAAEYVLAPFAEEESAELPDILARGLGRVEELVRLWDREPVNSEQGRGRSPVRVKLAAIVSLVTARLFSP